MRHLLLLLLLLLACGPTGTVRRPPPAAPDPPGDDPADAAEDTADTGEPAGPCPLGMVAIEDPTLAFCIDRYEAHLVDHSPYEVPTSGVAASAPGVVPQAHISGVLAEAACAAAGKRLCGLDEWMRACRGPDGWTYPYGNTYDPARCNTTRDQHPIVSLFGASADWSFAQMNDPRINQQPDTVDPAGANPDCVSAEGVYDLHGNLHEWIADPAGVFKGGFYVDAALNGPGCTYQTTAHGFGYHDYSTGFRCCADPGG